jgi:hypothetical protein
MSSVVDGLAWLFKVITCYILVKFDDILKQGRDKVHILITKSEFG